MKVTVTGSQPTYFMKVFGVTTMPTGAVAVAVHRPRDIAFVIDMTGSMGYSSRTNITVGLNDPNTAYPQSAHYQRYLAYSTAALGNSETGAVGSRPNPLRQTQTQISAPVPVYSPANLTIETSNGRAIVRDFYYDPSNVADPTTPVTSTNGTTLKNAFHQWSPPESGADPVNLVGPTYDFTGYASALRSRMTGMPRCSPKRRWPDRPTAPSGSAASPISWTGSARTISRPSIMTTACPACSRRSSAILLPASPWAGQRPAGCPQSLWHAVQPTPFAALQAGAADGPGVGRAGFLADPIRRGNRSGRPVAAGAAARPVRGDRHHRTSFCCCCSGLLKLAEPRLAIFVRAWRSTRPLRVNGA